MKPRLWYALTVALVAVATGGFLATPAWAASSVTEYRCGFEGGVLPAGWKANASFVHAAYQLTSNPSYAHGGTWELKQEIYPYSNTAESTDLKLTLPDDGVRYELEGWFYVDSAYTWGMTTAPFTFVFPGSKTVGVQVTSDYGTAGYYRVFTGSGNQGPYGKSTPQRAWHRVRVTYDRLANTEDVAIDGVTVVQGRSLDTSGAAPTAANFSSVVTMAKGNAMRQYLDDLVVRVTRPNRPPAVSASNDFVAAPEGGMLANVGLVSDPDGDALMLTASRGTVTNRGDGTWSWSEAATDGPAGGGPVTITVSDGEDARSVTFTCVVSNVAPVPIVPVEVTGREGSAFSAEGSFADPGADVWSATVDYGDGSGEQQLALAEGKTFALSHTYADDGRYEVRVSVRDEDGGVGVSTMVADVANVAPAVSLPIEGSAVEGSAFSAEGSFADPGTDVWSASVDYGDGSGEQQLALAEGKTFALSHTYADDGRYEVRVSVRDGDGGVGVSTMLVDVANVAPAVSLPIEGSAVEGSAFSAEGSFADPGTDVWSATVDYGDGSGEQQLALAEGKTFALSHTYADDGRYEVRVSVRDGDGGVGEAVETVTVANVAPVVGSIQTSAPTELDVDASAPFNDMGVNDAHTASWDWGDGTTSAGAVAESGGAGTATGKHTYAQPGTFTLRVVVSDGDGGSSEATAEFTVTLPETSGFVTGGGWMTSPRGALSADPKWTGKATFGFAAFLAQGATVPTGSFEFHLQEPKLRFKSTRFDRLAISDETARLSGEGTLGGKNVYAFLLVAKVGAQDALRVRIWKKSTAEVVYDSQPGAPDSAAPSLTPGGGNIVVHAAEAEKAKPAPVRRHGHSKRVKGR